MSDFSVSIVEPEPLRLVITAVDADLIRLSSRIELINKEALDLFDDGLFDGGWISEESDVLMARNIFLELQAIAGVERVRLDRYSAFVRKGEAFDWTDVILACLQAFADTVFKTSLKGIFLQYPKLPVRVRECIREYVSQIK